MSDDSGERPSGDLTRALNDGGLSALPPEVEAELLAELRSLGEAHMARERSDHTLQVTALVNEAFLKLSRPATEAERGYASRGHFLAMASRVMRSVLVDHARRRKSKKRGGDWTRVTLAVGAPDDGQLATTAELLDLSSALDQLMDLKPDLAEVIDLRFFGGLAPDEIAAALDVSQRTVERRLRASLAWLVDRLGAELAGGPDA